MTHIFQYFLRTFRFMRACAMRALAALAVAIAMLSSPAAHAVNYQDTWWIPSENGWGMNIMQQGETLFATWYVYDQTGAPIWFAVPNGQKTATNTFTGRVFTIRGSFFAGAWNPASFVPSDAGSATFTFTDRKTLNLRYSVGSNTVNKTLTRITYAALPLAGDFYGAELGQPTNCANNTRYYAFSLFTVTASYAAGTSGGPIKIVQQVADTGSGTFICTLDGNFTQFGTLVEGTGTYACNSGVTGSWTFTDGQFGTDSFSLRLSGALNNSSCRVESVYSGSRN
jgi:hypothetical protein